MRVVSATHRDLESAIREDRFRATGRWRGSEVHLDDSDVPSNRAFRRFLDRDGPRVRCWCGSGEEHRQERLFVIKLNSK